MELNKYQTPLTDELLDTLPLEVRDELIDILNNVEIIKRLVSPTRLYAKDLPRDDEGKIIVDICNPHILLDMDYFRPTALHYKKYGTLTNLKPNPSPYSEYRKWLNEEIRRCWEGYVRESDGEWVTGDMYFYLNYSPIILSKTKKGTKIADRIVDFPEVWEGIYLRFHYIYQARYGGLYNNFRGGLHAAEIAKRGCAHPYSQRVITPNGIKDWGDIKVGDYLFGDDGLATLVIDIPFDDDCDIYNITLLDGRTVLTSDNHLWKVLIDNETKILSTSLLLHTIKSGITCSIPTNKGVDFEYRPTKISPYVLGRMMPLFLTSGPINKSLDEKIRVYSIYSTKTFFNTIPNEYKFNSRKVRLDVLKGLLDSSGYISYRRTPSITVHSEVLRDDILFICRSLGVNCDYKTSLNTSSDTLVPSYTIYIYTDKCLFRLHDKMKLLKDTKIGYYKSHKDRTVISNIEFSHREKAKCVTVDNKSHCYLIGDFVTTHNSKSYTMASILSKIFILGESETSKSLVKGLITAYLKEYLNRDGTLNKFVSMIDFCAQHTLFPSKRVWSSIHDMLWKMGYLDLDTGTTKGTLNEVIGVSSKDDVDKLRGKRSSRIFIEEYGNFPKITDIYRVILPSVLEGDIAFGQIYLVGTGGSEGADFAGALEMIYGGEGYNLYMLPNYYDKNSSGKNKSVYFFGAYLNKKECYNEDGVSDVIKALIELLMNRYLIKYNTTNPTAITRTKAENPITIQEAIMRRDSTLFPVADLSERLNEIDFNPSEYNDVYVGELLIKNGEVEFKPTSLGVIREFPLNDNKSSGAIEIYKMPEKNKDGKVFSGRYIAATDPVDDDSSETLSLLSSFILDLWTDEIVAEYTGRPAFANDYYELLRRLLIFYNAIDNYENNKKGLFAYFLRMNSLYLLSDTLEFLKDKDMIKGLLYGNKLKGCNATLPINNFGRTLIRDWLLKPVTVIKTVDGLELEIQVPLLLKLRGRALIKELILWGPDGNYDRVSALGMLMLLREDRLILSGGNIELRTRDNDSDYLGNDKFFAVNYDLRFKRSVNLGANPSE